MNSLTHTRKVIVTNAGLLGLVLMILFWGTLPRIMDQLDARWMRDLRGVTPFHAVVVDRVEVISATEIEVEGTLIKSRDCPPFDQPIVVLQFAGEDFVRFGTFRQPNPASAPPRRPVSPFPQRFGPWQFIAPKPNPASVSMFRIHQCPGEDSQTNMVLTVPWATSNERQAQ